MVYNNVIRVAKFKRPPVLGDQKMSEDNQELRPGCPPDYQIFVKELPQKLTTRFVVIELPQQFSSQEYFQAIFLLVLPTKTVV